MAAALLCTRCGAPLPPPTLDGVTTLTCNFCGTTNLLERHSGGHTEIRRAVKRELDQRLGAPPRSHPMPATSPALVAVVSIGLALALGVAAYVHTTASQRVSPRPVLKSPPLPKPMPVPPIPAPPVFERPEPILAMAIDEAGDVLALNEKSLRKLDATTLDEKWNVPFKFKASISSRTILIPRHERIALASDGEAVFIDAATGAETGRYLLNNAGILEHACGAGKSQLVMYVLGNGWSRFDALTGKLATGTETCTQREVISSPPGQWAGWNTVQYKALHCTNGLRVGAERYRECKTDDGTKRRVIAGFDAKGKQKWVAEGPGPDNFFGLVNGKVIVGDGRVLNAYDAADGTLAWSKPGVTSTVSDGTTLVIANEAGFTRLTP